MPDLIAACVFFLLIHFVHDPELVYHGHRHHPRKPLCAGNQIRQNTSRIWFLVSDCRKNTNANAMLTMPKILVMMK